MTMIRILFLFGWIAAGVSAPLSADLRVVDLRCEYASDPMGIDVAEPRLFWRLESETRGQRQTAWQVLAASSRDRLDADEGDLWDSGRVEGGDTVHVRYAGAELEPAQKVYWKVRSWDSGGNPSDWSDTATWTMGLWTVDQWGPAGWIQAAEETPSVLLRREFDVRGGLKRAIAYVSGLGHYEMYVNGEKSGEDLLTPGWTKYDVSALYDTHDITGFLKEGANAVGMELANGMYHVRREGRFGKFQGSFGDKRGIALIRLEYADGTVDVIGTDASWRSHAGPVTFTNMFGGEDHDARLEPAGWKELGFDDSAWAPARLVEGISRSTLRGHRAGSDPVRVIEKRAPVEVRELAGPGATLYDFGQNTSYMPRLVVTGPRGSRVRLIPGERIYPDGYPSRASMGGIHRGTSWWEYTKATDGKEVWYPRFFYIGSRYIQAQTFAPEEGGERAEVVSVDGLIIHADAEPTGTFDASDPLLGRIRELVRWAQRSNMVSVLTDCPHREKLGWLEQIHLNGPSLRYEWDLARIFSKAMFDMADSQTEEGLIPNIAPEFTEFRGTFRAAAEWGAAFIQVPWQQYQFNGDTDLLERFYPAMREYFAYLESRAEDDILSEGLGDWFDLGPRRPPGRAQLTLPPITATSYFFNNAKVLSEIASILGEEEDARHYAMRRHEIRTAFNDAFFDAEGGFYGDNTQAANAMPLVLGIVETEERDRVFASLLGDLKERDYALTAGAVGYRYLLQALTQGGRDDVIHRMITQDDKPGYAWQLKAGATALTESWEAHATTSNNHFMLGHITEWFYKDLAGIRLDPEHPGFAGAIIEPRPVDGLDWVEATYKSVRGPVAVRWERSGDAFRLKVTVPPNSTAEVRVPARRDTDVHEGGVAADSAEGVSFVRRTTDRAVYRVESGTYTFTSDW